jgi:hypothetical protein
LGAAAQALRAARKGILPLVFCRLCVNHPPKEFGGIYEGREFFSSVRLSILRWPDPSITRSFRFLPALAGFRD